MRGGQRPAGTVKGSKVVVGILAAAGAAALSVFAFVGSNKDWGAQQDELTQSKWFTLDFSSKNESDKAQKPRDS
jgi:hypothetical protein